MNEVKYALKSPVKFGDKTITEVSLRKPIMRDLKGVNMKDPGVEEMGLIFGRIADQGSEFFDMLDIKDGVAISELIGDFLA